MTRRILILISWILFWRSISTEDWETHFQTQESNPKKYLSLDPAMLCQPSLQESNLVEIYNGINLNLLIMRKIQLTDSETALFLNGSETIFVSSAQTLPDAVSNCKKEGSEYLMLSRDSTFLAAVLKTTVNSKVIPRVMFSISCKETKALTLDEVILAAKGSCNEQSPYAIFSATGLTLATPTTVVPAILCRKNSLDLSENLKNFEAALNKELLLIESTLSALRTKLQNIFEIFVHSSTLHFTTNLTGTLTFLNPQPKTCLEVKIIVGNPLQNHSLPIIVTPENLVTASQLLRSRIDESKSLIKKMSEIFDHVLSPENAHSPISVQYSIRYFSDIFDLLPIHSREKMLSVILLTTIGFVLLLSICLLSGYNVILCQGAREWIRRMVFTTNVQVNPPPPNTIPLIQQR